MSVFKYKTRGNSSPDRKQKIYLCMHSQDYKKYFEIISEDILTKQNCVIWYVDDSETSRDEEFFAALEQMQLFVMPVTAELLSTKNKALDVDFPFALEHHIPVLPVMLEDGNIQLFNKKCGNLQYLDRNQKDGTTASYEEKLEKCLSAVLIEDDFADKIRAAFDAYIFLSYRKKDRKYAQELMHLIHKNEFCRDMAIWYDEFLTPGENFNDSIREALQKSDLFVMAVTPNLVNEENYVMTTEYPMAKEEGKNILPAELVPTDRQLLSEKYQALPCCTDAYNEAELSQILFENIQKIALGKKDDSPEHNFFIGLAYLGGIDVEINYERAVALITSAAEEGLVEAMDKLVDMYRHGIGIARSMAKAIEWQEYRITHLEKQYHTKKEKKQLITLLQATIQCGDDYQKQKKDIKANELYKKVIGYIDLTPFELLHYPVSRYMVMACSRLGNLCMAHGEYEQAKNYYIKAIHNMEKEHSKPELSFCYGRLGDIYYYEQNSQQAEVYYLQALQITEEMMQIEDTLQVRRRHCHNYKLLGDFYLKTDTKKAIHYYEKSVILRIAIAKESRSMADWKEYLKACHFLGNICRLYGDYRKAKLIFGRMLEAVSVVTEEYDISQIQREDFTHTKSRLYFMQGRCEQISEQEMYEEILSAKGQHQWNWGCYLLLTVVLFADNHTDAAKAYCRQSLQLCIKAHAESTAVKAKEKILLCYRHLYSIYNIKHNLAEEKDVYEKMLSLSTELIKQAGTMKSVEYLMMAYSGLTAIHEILDDMEGAKALYQKMIEPLTTAVEKTDSVESKANLAIIYYRLGQCCVEAKEMQQAKKYYLQAIYYSNEAVQQDGSVSTVNYLKMLYGEIIPIYISEGEFTKAQELCEEIISILTKFVKETDSDILRYALEDFEEILASISCKI